MWCCDACSGDVGIGLNARRLRDNFLKRFVTTYSLRPVGEIGTVFKRYPEQWKVRHRGQQGLWAVLQQWMHVVWTHAVPAGLHIRSSHRPAA
jgi:hypothetical protein